MIDRDRECDITVDLFRGSRADHDKALVREYDAQRLIGTCGPDAWACAVAVSIRTREQVET